MDKLKLKIVTPEKEIFDSEVSQVNVPTSEGELGILPHHSNIMAKVIPGELTIKQGDKSIHLAVGEGFLKVLNNTLTIMTDLAITSNEIDERKVEEAKKRAELAMEKTLSDEEYAATIAIIERSVAQLKVRHKHHNR